MPEPPADRSTEAILDAAVCVFSRRGVAAATMAEVAEEAGLSAGAIYNMKTRQVEKGDAKPVPR